MLHDDLFNTLHGVLGWVRRIWQLELQAIAKCHFRNRKLGPNLRDWKVCVIRQIAAIISIDVLPRFEIMHCRFVWMTLKSEIFTLSFNEIENIN